MKHAGSVHKYVIWRLVKYCDKCRSSLDVQCPLVAILKQPKIEEKNLQKEGFQSQILQGLFTRLVETVTYDLCNCQQFKRYSMPPGNCI